MSEIPINNTTYLTGFAVKPNEISNSGLVTFTDGTKEITPNQLQCESYGYTYNQVNGTCSAYVYNTNLERVSQNENNRTYGSGNTPSKGINNTLIMGENNTAVGSSRNNLIIGSDNNIGGVSAISNIVTNSIVSGTLGEVKSTNSTVLGGNAPDDLLGERQAIRVIYGKQTTSAATLASNLNNTAGSFFKIPINTAIYFNATILAVRVGGTNTGDNGDYLSMIERGVAINKSGVTTIQRERDVIKSSGTITGWNAVASVSGDDFSISVRGRNSVTLEWICNIEITQLKSGVAL